MVGRGDREVAAFVTRLVAEVAPCLFLAGVPRCLDGVDGVERTVGLVVVADVVEYVELGFWTEIRRVSHPGARQVLLGLTRDVARVAAVGLAGQRVVDEEGHVQRLVLPERVNVGGRGIREQEHVRLVDRLESADRRTVERQAVFESGSAEIRHRKREVLHDARQIAEAGVDEFDFVIADIPQNLVLITEQITLRISGWPVIRRA